MLTLQFVPYADIESLDSQARISKLLKIVKNKHIVLMQGRLRPEEEAGLIQKTMEQIDKEFRGIEVCTVYPEENKLESLKKIRNEMFKLLLGNRDGITIIGPASVVKEIRRDPNKIQLLTLEKSKGVKKISKKK